MAVTKSVGYPGPITGADLAYWEEGLGRDYRVETPNSWKVVALTNGARQVTVLAGSGSGRGIRDTSTDTTLPSLDAQVSGGTRYDLIVARRNWSTKVTSFAIVKGGATQEGAFALRNVTPGTLDDQPLAVVPVSQGAADVGTPIDVRVWQANGAACARSDLVLQYLNTPGTSVLINSKEWHRTVDAAGNPQWQTAWLNPVSVVGVTNPLVGPPPGVDRQFVMQGGTNVLTSDALAYARITYPVPFAGVVSVMVQNGDGAAPALENLIPVLGWQSASGPTYDAVSFVYRLREMQDGHVASIAGRLHRVNWLALGWL